ncbi:D-alanyl-D-alanine carboxypeptidase, partial [Streptomyces sp. NPDC048192]|uniref:D-alanyl-D-alanine carboxypeptidase n=1 Tax=Streptomyces sp. NPDC048192 TaxID=3365510 RepID=UPI00371E842E
TKADTGTTADAKPGTDATADTGATADADAGGSADTQADAATGADGGSGADGGTKADTGTTADAKPGTDATADTGATADADAGGSGDTKADAGTDADGGSGAGAASRTKTDTRAKADAKPDTDAEADADAKGSADTEADAATGADGGSGAGAASETKADTTAKTGTTADTDATADAKSDTDAEGSADTKAGAGAGSTAVAGVKEEADAEVESPAQDDADADTNARGVGAEAEADSDGDAVADAKDEPAAKTQPKGEAKADAGARASGEAQAKADAKPDAKGEPEDVAAAAAEVRPEHGDGEAEDSEDAPQGPPAADGGSRTGDAGGGGAPVDQPTAVFKAVRPKRPEVDQPTTMLKLGGKPKAPESDSERTSKFVALKNDMAPAKPDATTPVPQVGPERTTQQPLPPKPPLDLLAELTNTPPPPETALRTLVRRVKIWTPLVLLLAVVFAIVQTLRPLPDPTLDLTAKDTYTFAGGKVDIPWPAGGEAALDVQGIGTFGSSGAQKPVPIASVAKVMTAYIVLRDHPLKSGADGPKIKIDKAAEQQSNAGQESTVHVTAGDSVSQREALESILIASANNIARLLARWDAGSEKAFVAKMNATAKGLGMTNTTYTDPSGLTDSTVSTAVDQVKLAKAAMTEPAFREVAAMMSYTDYKGVNHSNWNHLVGSNNVVGIKTGTTTSALGNLVFAAKQQVGGGTRMIIGAVLRQPAGGSENTILSAALDHSDQLIRAAQGALKSVTILKKGDVVGYVDDGLGGRTPVVATKDVTAAGWAGLKVRLSLASGTVPHTAKAGTEVGSLTVGDGSTGAVKVPVALQKDLAEPGFGAKLTRLG